MRSSNVAIVSILPDRRRQAANRCVTKRAGHRSCIALPRKLPIPGYRMMSQVQRIVTLVKVRSPPAGHRKTVARLRQRGVPLRSSASPSDPHDNDFRPRCAVSHSKCRAPIGLTKTVRHHVIASCHPLRSQCRLRYPASKRRKRRSGRVDTAIVRNATRSLGSRLIRIPA
jgi:hypothetical protein